MIGLSSGSFSLAIPLAALVLSCGTLVYTSMINRQRADKEYVDELERRIEILERNEDRLEEDLNLCRKGRGDLQADNYRLMTRIFALEAQIK